MSDETALSLESSIAYLRRKSETSLAPIFEEDLRAAVLKGRLPVYGSFEKFHTWNLGELRPDYRTDRATLSNWIKLTNLISKFESSELLLELEMQLELNVNATNPLIAAVNQEMIELDNPTNIFSQFCKASYKSVIDRIAYDLELQKRFISSRRYTGSSSLELSKLHVTSLVENFFSKQENSGVGFVFAELDEVGTAVLIRDDEDSKNTWPSGVEIVFYRSDLDAFQSDWSELNQNVSRANGETTEASIVKASPGDREPYRSGYVTSSEIGEAVEHCIAKTEVMYPKPKEIMEALIASAGQKASCIESGANWEVMYWTLQGELKPHDMAALYSLLYRRKKAILASEK